MLILVVGASLLSSLFSCSSNKADPRTLIVGTTMKIDSLNRLDTNGGAPGYNFDKIAGSVSQLSPIAKIDGEYVDMCCAYTVDESNSSVTLSLKDGYKWHDGFNLSLDDIEYTIASSLEEGKDYKSVTKSGDSLTYAVDLPSSFLDSIVSESIYPKRIFEGKDKEDISDEESVIGLGPFKFSNIDKNSGTITFDKFPSYPFAQDIYFSKVIFKQYGSEDVMSLALKSGEIDMMFDYAKGLSASSISAFEDDEAIQLISQSTKLINKVLFFNNEKLKDARVKRAIALSIDFDKIRSTFASSSVSPSREGFIGEGIKGYKETPIWKRDLEKAKALLSEAGYSSSNKFVFELLLHAGTDDNQYASLLKSEIEENDMVSVSLLEKGSDWQSYYQAGNHMASLAKITAKGYDFDAGYGSRYTLSSVSSFCPISPNPVSHGQMKSEDSDGNLTEYGKILKALKEAKNEEELLLSASSYQDYMMDNVLCVPLFYDGLTYGAKSELTGFVKDDASGILNVKSFETLKRI